MDPIYPHHPRVSEQRQTLRQLVDLVTSATPRDGGDVFFRFVDFAPVVLSALFHLRMDGGICIKVYRGRLMGSPRFGESALACRFCPEAYTQPDARLQAEPCNHLLGGRRQKNIQYGKWRYLHCISALSGCSFHNETITYVA